MKVLSWFLRFFMIESFCQSLSQFESHFCVVFCVHFLVNFINKEVAALWEILRNFCPFDLVDIADLENHGHS
jgi:hypothetical protein